MGDKIVVGGESDIVEPKLMPIVSSGIVFCWFILLRAVLKNYITSLVPPLMWSRWMIQHQWDLLEKHYVGGYVWRIP